MHSFADDTINQEDLKKAFLEKYYTYKDKNGETQTYEHADNKAFESGKLYSDVTGLLMFLTSIGLTPATMGFAPMQLEAIRAHQLAFSLLGGYVAANYTMDGKRNLERYHTIKKEFADAQAQATSDSN